MGCFEGGRGPLLVPWREVSHLGAGLEKMSGPHTQVMYWEPVSLFFTKNNLFWRGKEVTQLTVLRVYS